MMKTTFLRSIVLLVIAAGLIACSNRRDSGQSAEIIEGTGISETEMADIDRARASGIGSQDELDIISLDGGGASNAQCNETVIFFEYDSDAVLDSFRCAIETHVNRVMGRPGSVLTLEGHADERGSREYNLALGERRALSVRRMMMLLGVPASQIRTVSHGEERPAVDGHDEQSYAQNRRVEIVY